MQQVKDLSVTKLVSSCFQEKKKIHGIYDSCIWHLANFPCVQRPQRWDLTTAVTTLSVVFHTPRGPETQKPGDISILETRYRKTLYMYLKTLPSTSALTCHFLALPASEHSVLGAVSQLDITRWFYGVDTHLPERRPKGRTHHCCCLLPMTSLVLPLGIFSMCCSWAVWFELSIHGAEAPRIFK